MSAAPLRVVVTRDEGLDGPLSSALAERGLEAVHCAVVGEAPAPDAEPLERAARSLECYDWLVVASQRWPCSCSVTLTVSGTWRPSFHR